MKAQLFEDQVTPGDWHVEREDEDGEIEVAIFVGPDARARAVMYADRLYGDFAEVSPAENSQSRTGAKEQPFSPIFVVAV